MVSMPFLFLLHTNWVLFWVLLWLLLLLFLLRQMQTQRHGRRWRISRYSRIWGKEMNLLKNPGLVKSKIFVLLFLERNRFFFLFLFFTFIWSTIRAFLVALQILGKMITYKITKLNYQLILKNDQISLFNFFLKWKGLSKDCIEIDFTVFCFWDYLFFHFSTARY